MTKQGNSIPDSLYNPAALAFQDGISITGGGQVVIPTVSPSRQARVITMSNGHHN